MESIQARNTNLRDRNIGERIDFVDCVNSPFDNVVSRGDIVLNARPQPVRDGPKDLVNLGRYTVNGTTNDVEIIRTSLTAPIKIASPPRTTNSRKHRNVDL